METAVPDWAAIFSSTLLPKGVSSKECPYDPVMHQVLVLYVENSDRPLRCINATQIYNSRLSERSSSSRCQCRQQCDGFSACFQENSSALSGPEQYDQFVLILFSDALCKSSSFCFPLHFHRCACTSFISVSDQENKRPGTVSYGKRLNSK